MAITLFQPAIWSAQILSILQKELVYGSSVVANRNYEGEISAFGSSVKIATVSDVAIQSYTKDTDLTIAALTDAQKTLTIDQQKAFAFEIDDIDMAQTRAGGALMAEAAFRSAFGLRDVADQYLAGLMKASATLSVGTDAAPLALSAATDGYDKVLVPLSQKLDENNVPTEGRYCVVNPGFYSKLLLDSRFIKVNESGTQALHTGVVGGALGMTILKSNNAPATGGAGGHYVFAGTNQGLSYAEQISKVEAFRPQARFADALKGLHLYGGLVTRPEAIVSAAVVA